MGMFKKILPTVAGNNDFLTVFVRKHYKYLMLVFVLIILYISNGLIYDLEVRRQNKLDESLLRAKVKYNMKFMEFIEFSSYRNIIDLSNKYDLKLEESNRPPIKVEK
jgi:cell division protein FtsL